MTSDLRPTIGPADMQERLQRACARLCEAKSWETAAAQADLRRVVALAWPYVDRYSRSKFVAWLDDELLYAPPPNLKPEDVEDIELTGILQDWPKVLMGLSGKDRDFGADVEKRRRFRNWKPSEKQTAWIKRLHADWKMHSDDTDIEVTE